MGRIFFVEPHMTPRKVNRSWSNYSNLKKIYYVFYAKRLCKKPSILQNNISLTKTNLGLLDNLQQLLLSELNPLRLRFSYSSTNPSHTWYKVDLWVSALKIIGHFERKKISGILNNWKLFYLRLLLNPNWTKVRLQLKYFLFIFLHTGSNLSVSALPHQSERFQNKYCGDLTKRRFILCYGLIKLQKFVNY